MTSNAAHHHQHLTCYELQNDVFSLKLKHLQIFKMRRGGEAVYTKLELKKIPAEGSDAQPFQSVLSAIQSLYYMAVSLLLG